MELKAIGASNGIAIAKVYKLIEQRIEVEKEQVTNIEEQLRNLEQALDVSLTEIRKLYTETLKKLGEDKAKIFMAHEQIISDPTIIDEIKQMITSEQVTSSYASFVIANKYIAMFKAMDDAYMRERASDIEDVTNRLIKHLLGIKIQDLAIIDEEVIIVSSDLTPSQTVQLNPEFVKGFLCDIGGRTSHAAIMARSLEIPAIVGLKDITSKVENDELIIMDGKSGVVITNPTSAQQGEWKELQTQWKIKQQQLQKYKDEPTITLDGHKVTLEGNIGSFHDVDSVIDNGGNGVGLFRSEFLYMNSNQWPTEEEQFQAYKAVLEKIPNDMVVIRTLDIGGDKHLSYYHFESEMNPFLGYRAIRLCLDQIDVFKTQLRALLRASVYGKLAIMFPMIATVNEFKEAKAITLQCKEELKQENIAVSDDIQIGMMVEIPVAAVMSDIFSQYADFVSIGTNDLIQYGIAVDRMSPKISYLYQPYHPGILRLIKMTIDGAHLNKKWVGMCGEMAGEILALPLLLGMGLDYFSMSSTSILEARKIINSLTKKDTVVLVNEALKSHNENEVITLVTKFLQEKKLI
ncbi:phosphoenolpyruvate--protein phosphotransferase [Spiroplasma endosymbiont of 'Nebria riversi']|uniref:phosphoenolpyruvate--protein phosphotransferase n=1 Tax=Spiroplasma endosymbiont of 'Nebria riversi' TaxID=2792084 RepID=UPI001C041529|nr:phosphoenolpyruvate--protein phosphotransferase [Spiroplasma endosymbiont of 'Nebria riversi']